MDTPENHLHPNALVDTMRRVVNVNRNGQLWIATHSVEVIASLLHEFPNDTSLYCVEHGAAFYAGREPERVLSSLVGGEQNIQALRDFIDLPDVMAKNRFAAECVLPATVVAKPDGDDPQVQLAANTIFPCQADNAPRVRLLDFGAGSGRLLDSFSIGHHSGLCDRLDYVAWDLSDRCRGPCESVIARIYGNSSNRWFTDRNAFFASADPHSFDCAVMCNVLHEIDPEHWLDLFSEGGILARSLKNDGRLVIVEDYLMPVGELAHSFGFIVLDTESLRVLFGDTAIQVIGAKGKYNGRIRAHVASRAAFAKVTPESRSKALRTAQINARDQVRRIRSQKQHSFRIGQEHAFWTTQFANATLACERFSLQ